LRFRSTNRIARPNAPGNLAPLPAAAVGNPGSVSAPRFQISSVAGSNPSLTTFSQPSRNFFVTSAAFGNRTFTAGGGQQPGAWIQIAGTKTNGVNWTMAVTNQAGTGTLLDLVTALANAVNATSILQGTDGLIAGDCAAGWFGAATFNLRARSSGAEAAALRVSIQSGNGPSVSPAGWVQLDQNADDLFPRNHLYVTAGTTNLEIDFSLNTAQLPDGFHELTAVAYEGSNVRTQTRAPLPVRITNSALTATLTAVNLPTPASAQGAYQFQVMASAGNVTNITLHTTGGPWASALQQNSAVFTVDATRLGVGLHPFYAMVATSSNQRFRTPILWVRLTP
jgi:hypothetical protein